MESSNSKKLSTLVVRFADLHSIFDDFLNSELPISESGRQALTQNLCNIQVLAQVSYYYLFRIAFFSFGILFFLLCLLLLLSLLFCSHCFVCFVQSVELAIWFASVRPKTQPRAAEAQTKLVKKFGEVRKFHVSLIELLNRNFDLNIERYEQANTQKHTNTHTNINTHKSIIQMQRANFIC
jgi:hypothetical protein